jgi:membrane fusion protein, heavy metal efflux system
MMKTTLLTLAPLLFLAACSGAPSEVTTASSGASSVTFTHYSDLTEIFAEHRPLVVGKDRRFDTHLSWLADYRAVSSGTLTVELIHADGRVDTGRADVSETPGIFRVLVKASKAGKPKLRFILNSGGRTSVHDLGPVEVYVTRELAEKANPEPPENPNRIALSKEVQWKIPFLTGIASTKQLELSVPVTVDVRFAPDAEAAVAAPLAGIVRVNGAVPAPGGNVRAGQQLGSIAIQMGQGTDVISADSNIVTARISVQAAERDLARLRGLYQQEAVPLRRVQDAETALRIAQAGLNSSARQRRTLTNSDTSIALIAPISGQILSSKMIRGGSVEQGAELLRIGDPSALWLIASVPEAMATRVANPTAIEVSIDGKSQKLDAGSGLRLVQAGSFVDPATKMMDVIFAISGGGFKSGTRLSGALAVGKGAPSLVVPGSAVIDEGGQTVIYVQVAGETFERRIVTVTQRSGELAAISGDLKSGERVVTVGAAAVRAAAATPDAFGHGHAH